MGQKKNVKKVLILYAKVGGGHESIANALREKLEEYLKSSVQIELVDPTNSFMNSTYQLSTVISTKFYNTAYKLFQQPLTHNIINSVARLLYDNSLKEVVLDFEPDVIISTHFMFSKQAKEIVTALNKNIPVGVYIADPFSIHPVWYAEGVDLYICYEKPYLPHKIATSKVPIIEIGMPIRQAFYGEYPRAKTLEKIGFDPSVFTILFGGSGSGMDNLERVAKPFLDLELSCQVMFICGRNKLLETALKVLVNGKKNGKIFGYLPASEIAAFMQAADVFVGKTGPNVMFETVLSRLVSIATPPILAQERGNRTFIHDKKIGFLSTSSSHTLKLLKRACENPKELDNYKQNIEKAREALINLEKKGIPQLVEWITAF